MCDKKVQKRRKKVKRNAGGAAVELQDDDHSGDDDNDSDSGEREMAARPERVRRWDHLRKIHRIVVCSGCDQHMIKPLLPAHILSCPAR